jgi:hypothetical protein
MGCGAGGAKTNARHGDWVLVLSSQEFSMLGSGKVACVAPAAQQHASRTGAKE